MSRTLSFFIISLILTFGGVLVYCYLTLPDIAQLRYKNPQTTAFMQYRKEWAKKEQKSYVIRKLWIPLNQIPQLLRQTVIVAEDAAFWTHKGIDWYEVGESLKKNLKKGRIVRGGSTITQQLAKNLYLSPGKTVFRKIREILIARSLEKHLRKSRILELYLNCIELGPGIFGIGAASQYYFQKNPIELQPWEMVRLAAVIPSPMKLNPIRPSRQLRWRSRVILSRLHQYQFISEEMFRTTVDSLSSFFHS